MIKKCKHCKQDIFRTSPKANNVKFCSVKCRNKFGWASGRLAEIQRRHNDKKRAENYDDLLRCELCGKGYRQLGGHVFQTHKMTARDYKRETGQDLNKGLLTADLKKAKSEYAYAYKQPERLIKVGKNTRFEKGHDANYERSLETQERLKEHWPKVNKLRWEKK